MVYNHAEFIFIKNPFRAQVPELVYNKHAGSILAKTKIYISDHHVSRFCVLITMRAEYLFCYRFTHNLLSKCFCAELAPYHKGTGQANARSATPYVFEIAKRM